MKCPNCGKDLTDGLMFCVYCGKPLDMSELADAKQPEKITAKKNEIEVKKGNGNRETSGVDLYTYKCKNCGASLSYTKYSLSTTCPYCGTTYGAEAEKIQEDVRPEKIIPFTVTEEQANYEFKKWLSKGFWAPRNMDKFSTINRLIPMYVPVWLFDADVTTQWSGQSGMWRSRQVAYKVKEGNTEKTEYRTENYTEWYPIMGEHEGVYTSVPVPASNALFEHVSKMKKSEGDVLSIVDSYNYGEAETFDSRYIMGCPVDAGIISSDDSMPIFKDRISKAEKKECLNMIPGDQRELSYANVSVRNIKCTLVYVPLYLSSFYYKKRIRYFLINGITNEVITQNKPISLIKILIAFSILVGLIVLIVYFD